MKNIRQIISTFLLGALLFLIGSLNVQAEQNLNELSSDFDLSYEAYEKLIEDGVLGTDVSFEYWVELNTRNSIIESEPLTETFTTYATFPNKAGDIYVTRSTSAKGVLGHTGIVINSSTILMTSGWSSEPYPMRISIADWHKRYPQTKVIRPNNSTLGVSAAARAIQYFDNKKIPYRITANPTNITNIYCSELVWYSYYKAGKEFKVYDKAMGLYLRPSIIAPYDFIAANNVSHNGFKFIDNAW